MKCVFAGWRMMSALWSRRTHLFSALAAILLLTCMQAPVIAHAQSAGSGDPPVMAASGEENATTTWSSLVRMIHDRSEQSQALRSRLDSIVHNPISPPDTRSPRATLSSFLVIMAEATSFGSPPVTAIWRDTACG